MCDNGNGGSSLARNVWNEVLWKKQELFLDEFLIEATVNVSIRASKSVKESHLCHFELMNDAPNASSFPGVPLILLLIHSVNPLAHAVALLSCSSISLTL